MAQRRMFSPEIVGSEEFSVMPKSSQALYFHLGMEADDDGFINPGKLMRSGGYQADDLKILLAKRFLLTFESGVVVIKHWLIHNMIRQDRYKETRYIDEKKSLFIKENKAYTDRFPIGSQNGNQMAPQVRLGKVREKDFSDEKSPPSEITRVNTTTEGEEVQPKKKYAHRGTPAWELREEFYDRIKQEKGHRPVPHAGDLANINAALKADLSEKDCREMFEDALADDNVRTVREAFSARRIDIYKQDNL